MSETWLFGIILLIVVCYTTEEKFSRKILGVGFPYYKILMSLGDCKETLLYDEQKIWRATRYNRVIDIYYKSEYENYAVSRVEILLVTNDTGCIARSEHGIGSHEFAATLIVKTNVGVIFYQLDIFSCSIPSKLLQHSREDTMTEEPNFENYLPYLKPDFPPHHIVFESGDDSED